MYDFFHFLRINAKLSVFRLCPSFLQNIVRREPAHFLYFSLLQPQSVRIDRFPEKIQIRQLPVPERLSSRTMRYFDSYLASFFSSWRNFLYISGRCFIEACMRSHSAWLWTGKPAQKTPSGISPMMPERAA